MLVSAVVLGDAPLESYLSKLLGDSFLLTLDGVKPLSMVNTVLIPQREHARLFSLLEEAKVRGAITNIDLGWFMLEGTLFFYNRPAIRSLLRNPKTKLPLEQIGCSEFNGAETILEKIKPHLVSRRKSPEDHLITGIALGFPVEDVAHYALAQSRNQDPLEDGRREVPLLGQREDSGAVFMQFRKDYSHEMEIAELRAKAQKAQTRVSELQSTQSALEIVNGWASLPAGENSTCPWHLFR